MDCIDFHKYVVHIFHTNDKRVWDYVKRVAIYNRFIDSAVANYIVRMATINSILQGIMRVIERFGNDKL